MRILSPKTYKVQDELFHFFDRTLHGVRRTKREQEHFTYIPLSSFVILIVILLTCASRRRKIETFNAVEQSLENDIKGDYAIMCFPCLKKKPELQDYEPTADLTDQFEYIVEKYTIRKVPLLLANTAEDIIERQEELEMAEAQQLSQPELIKDDFANFQLAPDECSIARGTPCITVAANTICPVRKSTRDKSKPSDILESMSPIPRPNIKNANYVVIPTKGSLRNKDIMMTKREITNQYLNNFSSVFVDNLKDQVPKDPEQFPNLSRPYTSAFKNLPLDETVLKNKMGAGKRAKRGKVQKVAYTFPTDVYEKDESFIKEEEDGYYDSDSGSKDQTTDVPESEFQEDEIADMTDKSKSPNDSNSIKDALEGVANPFKTTIKSSASEFDNCPAFDMDSLSNSCLGQKDEFTGAKVTYEDIQALDVGYEFTSCEKLGVKPKMTRIHYPHEGDRGKELKQMGDSKTSRRSIFLMDQPQMQISSSKSRSPKPKAQQRLSDIGCFSFFSGNLSPPQEQPSSKSLFNETSFLPKEASPKDSGPDTGAVQDLSTTTFVSKSEGSRSQSLNDIDLNASPSEVIDDSVAEISKLYDLAMPVSRIQTKQSAFETKTCHQEDETNIKFAAPSKSRSFQESGRQGTRKETMTEVKGKDYCPFPTPYGKNKSISGLDEPETETSCSMLSRDSKTSSAVTSPRSSEREEGKRATLRWKIVIKHHRDDDSSRKHVTKNIKL